jgi:hypothetical protein
MSIGGWGACCFAADVTICFTERKLNNYKTNKKKSTDIPTQVFPFCSRSLLTFLHQFSKTIQYLLHFHSFQSTGR